MINFDEMEGVQEGGEAESLAKSWKYLYDADFEILFNQIIFPEAILKGHLLGEYLIQKFELFDNDLSPS